MAKGRKANAIRSKVNMVVFGDKFTGKSTFASQFVYMKNPDGTPMKVLYLDPESGSIDDYVEKMLENGMDANNLYIVYTQSLAEVREYLRMVKDGEDLPELDDDGNDTGEIVLDGDGKPFRPDAIVIDGVSILNLTTKQSLVEFSKRRAKVKALCQDLTSDEKFVKIEGAGLELKDYNTINFKGQDLILDLNACGKHYVVTARETAEKVQREINGKSESVATGQKIPEGFKALDYNCKTLVRMYRDPNNYDVVHAYVVKDRTGVHKAGEDIEDPSLLDWQDIITKTANNTDVVIKNSLNDAVKKEEQMHEKEVGADSSVADKEDSKSDDITELRSTVTKALGALSPVAKNEAKKACSDAKLPTRISAIEDAAILNQILSIAKKFSSKE